MRPRARLEEAMRASERPSDRAMVAMALQEDRLRAQQHPGPPATPLPGGIQWNVQWNFTFPIIGNSTHGLPTMSF